MKKNLFRLSLLSFLAIPFVAACGGNEPKLPTTAKEKITFAFNGVASSMEAQQQGKRSLQPRLAKASQADVDALFALMDTEGQTENPEFPYAEPPMIQFQYVNALYKAVGDNFVLGTTYSDIITGEVDFDFSIDDRGKKQYYTMDLRLDIDIDSADLITVHCGMNVLYRDEEGNEHHQLFYAELFLDYDMKSTSPTYTLEMDYVDDCSSHPGEEAAATYEYDYVSTKENRITEWRKATLTTSKRLDMDAAHPNFESYLQDEGFKFIDGARGYRNNTLYHATRTGYSNPDHQTTRRALASLIVDRFKINTKEVPYQAFFAKSTTKNSKVTDVYKEFGRILGEDICQEIAMSGAHTFEDQAPFDDKIAGLALYYSNGQKVHDGKVFIIKADSSLGGLFSDSSVYADPTPSIPHIYFVNAAGDRLREASWNDMEAGVFLARNDGEAVPVTADTTITDLAYDIGYSGKMTLVLVYRFDQTNPQGGIYLTIFFDVSAVIGDTPLDSKPDKTEDSRPGTSTTSEEHVEITGFSAIGSFNNWEPQEGAYEFGPVVMNYYSCFFDLDAGESFYVIANHDPFLVYGFDELMNETLGNYFVVGQGGSLMAMSDVSVSIEANGKYADEVKFSVFAEPNDDKPVAIDEISVVGDFNKWDLFLGTYDFNKIGYSTRQLTFQIKAKYQFKVVINHSWDYGFGYNEIDAAGTAGLIVSGDNGNFKAAADLEITINAEGNYANDVIFMITAREITIETSEEPLDYDNVNYVALVGDMNNWDDTDTSCCLSYSSSKNCFEGVIGLTAGVNFKFVINRSWMVKSYGYNEIPVLSTDRQLFKLFSDDNSQNTHNIHVNQDCTVKITATGSKPSELTFEFSIIYS